MIMSEQILTWVFGIATTLFGGLNIFQWLTLRSYKRLKAAEADRSEIDNLKTTLDAIQTSMQQEIERLQKRVEDAERRANENAERYFALYEKYDKLRDEFERYKAMHK